MTRRCLYIGTDWYNVGFLLADDMVGANDRPLPSCIERGRQVVASFFTKDLQMDWRLGAEHFEEYLLDHDPASNWGNWNYVAGVGNDPRQDRYFKVSLRLWGAV